MYIKLGGDVGPLINKAAASALLMANEAINEATVSAQMLADEEINEAAASARMFADKATDVAVNAAALIELGVELGGHPYHLSLCVFLGHWL